MLHTVVAIPTMTPATLAARLSSSYTSSLVVGGGGGGAVAADGCGCVADGSAGGPIASTAAFAAVSNVASFVESIPGTVSSSAMGSTG